MRTISYLNLTAFKTMSKQKSGGLLLLENNALQTVGIRITNLQICYQSTIASLWSHISRQINTPSLKKLNYMSTLEKNMPPLQGEF